MKIAKGVFAADADYEQRIRLAMGLIEAELRSALKKHPSRTDSSHHHLCVVKEELYEAQTEVYNDNFMAAKKEMVQVGAMAARYMIEAQEEHASVSRN
jgi:hypothetical protein